MDEPKPPRRRKRVRVRAEDDLDTVADPYFASHSLSTVALCLVVLVLLGIVIVTLLYLLDLSLLLPDL